MTAHVCELVVVLTDDPFGKNCSLDLIKLIQFSILTRYIILHSVLFSGIGLYNFLPYDSVAGSEK